MASNKDGSLTWKNLRSAMADMQDLLRCWTCNKVFLDPVKYRCGHYFCGSCAKASGNKCGSCNEPSLVSEIKSDCVISNIAEGFQTLCTLINFEKKSVAEVNSSESSKKSSRSTLYEYELPITSTSSNVKVDHTSKKSNCAENPTNNLEEKQGPKKCNAKQSSRKKNMSEASLDLNTSNHDEFKRPSRLRKRNDKDNENVLSPKHKTKPAPSTRKETSSSSIQNAFVKKPAKVSKRLLSKSSSSDLSTSGDPDVKGTIKDLQDSFDSAKKPRKSSKPTYVSPARRAETSVIKSTPQRSSDKELSKKNHKGETSLHVACIKGNTERVQTLLKANASPNTKDHAGWTPLHEAAAHGFHEIVKLLVDAGALVSVPGANNVTPLHEAVTNNHLPIVKLLVAHGADIYARSSEGKTPMDFASSGEIKDALLNTKKILKSPEADSSFVNAHPIQMDMVLFGESSLTSEEKQDLNFVALQLGAKIASVFSLDVTHLVVASDETATCPPSMDVLCAILQGTFILTRDWVKISNSGGLHTDPEMFELRGVTDFGDTEAPMRSRQNADKQLPKLFNGCHFYVTNNASYKMPKCSFTKANIIHLIRSGGGIVLTRQPDPEAIPASEQKVPYHAPRDSPLSSTSHFIIYAPGRGEPELKYNMKHCKTLPVEWLIHCVLNWRLMEP